MGSFIVINYLISSTAIAALIVLAGIRDSYEDRVLQNLDQLGPLQSITNITDMDSPQYFQLDGRRYPEDLYWLLSEWSEVGICHSIAPIYIIYTCYHLAVRSMRSGNRDPDGDLR